MCSRMMKPRGPIFLTWRQAADELLLIVGDKAFIDDLYATTAFGWNAMACTVLRVCLELLKHSRRTCLAQVWHLPQQVPTPSSLRSSDMDVLPAFTA